MKNNIVILIHGPYAGNAYNKIFKSLKAMQKVIRQVVISTYVNDMKYTEDDIAGFHDEYEIKIIYNKDLINPGYFNLNRQIWTVRSGLEAIDDDKCLVIKIRNDQWCNTKKLYKILKKKYMQGSNTHKILTTNCYTRKDRFYHPSDMFLCGWKEDLEKYYSIPLQNKTHMDTQLYMQKKLKYSNDNFQNYLISPESELFKNYLKVLGWEIINTEEDSYNAIKSFMTIINTWDINLRWNKQRNAFLPAGTIILPYKFNLEPFQGAPRENAVCWFRHEFEGKLSIRDWTFIRFSSFVFDLMYKQSLKIVRSSLNRVVIVMVPRKIRKKLLKSDTGKALKAFLNA